MWWMAIRLHDGFTNVLQYPGGNYQGIDRNIFGLMGIQRAGGAAGRDWPEEQRNVDPDRVCCHVLRIGVVAEGNLSDIEPNRADSISQRGSSIDGSE